MASIYDDFSAAIERLTRLIDQAEAIVIGPAGETVTLPDGEQINTFRESLAALQRAADNIFGGAESQRVELDEAVDEVRRALSAIESSTGAVSTDRVAVEQALDAVQVYADLTASGIQAYLTTSVAEQALSDGDIGDGDAVLVLFDQQYGGQGVYYEVVSGALVFRYYRFDTTKTIFISSETGSDAATGDSPATAVRTFARADELARRGDTISIARDERLFVHDVGKPESHQKDYLTWTSHGGGRRPIIDGSELVPPDSWEPVAAHSGIYQATVELSEPVNAGRGTDAAFAYGFWLFQEAPGDDPTEAGTYAAPNVRMRRQGVRPNGAHEPLQPVLDALAENEFTVRAENVPDQNPQRQEVTRFVFYARFRGDADPRSGAISAYHSTANNVGVFGLGHVIQDIIFQRNRAKDFISAPNSDRYPARYENCQFLDCNNHGPLLHGAVAYRCYARGSQTWKWDGLASTLGADWGFHGYRTQASVGMLGEYRVDSCIAESFKQPFGYHGGTDGDIYSRASVTNCTAVSCENMGTFSSGGEVHIENCVFLGFNRGPISPARVHIKRSIVVMDSAVDSLNSLNGPTSLDNVLFVAPSRSFSGVGDIDIEQSTVLGGSPTPPGGAFEFTGHLIASNSIISGIHPSYIDVAAENISAKRCYFHFDLTSLEYMQDAGAQLDSCISSRRRQIWSVTASTENIAAFDSEVSVSTTAGSTTISASDDPDVAVRIKIPGAGDGGAPLYTHVVSSNGDGTYEIANAASVAVSDVLLQVPYVDIPVMPSRETLSTLGYPPQYHRLYQNQCPNPELFPVGAYVRLGPQIPFGEPVGTVRVTAVSEDGFSYEPIAPSNRDVANQRDKFGRNFATVPAEFGTPIQYGHNYEEDVLGSVTTPDGDEWTWAADMSNSGAAVIPGYNAVDLIDSVPNPDPSRGVVLVRSSNLDHTTGTTFVALIAAPGDVVRLQGCGFIEELALEFLEAPTSGRATISTPALRGMDIGFQGGVTGAPAL